MTDPKIIDGGIYFETDPPKKVVTVKPLDFIEYSQLEPVRQKRKYTKRKNTVT